MSTKQLQKRNAKAENNKTLESENCETHVPKLDERFITNIKGKDFVLYAGVLDLATQMGLVCDVKSGISKYGTSTICSHSRATTTTMIKRV